MAETALGSCGVPLGGSAEWVHRGSGPLRWKEAPAAFPWGADSSENRHPHPTPSVPNLPFLGHLFPDSALRPRERPPLVARATAPLFPLREFSNQAPSVPGPSLPTILEAVEPAGPHSILRRASLSGQDVEEGETG